MHGSSALSSSAAPKQRLIRRMERGPGLIPDQPCAVNMPGSCVFFYLLYSEEENTHSNRKVRTFFRVPAPSRPCSGQSQGVSWDG